MSKYDELGAGGVAFLLFLMAVAVALFITAVWSVGDRNYCEGYRDGQIHALSGQSKLHLETQPSGETKWVEGVEK